MEGDDEGNMNTSLIQDYARAWRKAPHELRPEIKIMVVGKTGSGKSTLCNYMCGLGPGDEANRNYFRVSDNLEGETTEIREVFFEGGVCIVDTPGIPDPDKRKTLGYVDMICEYLRTHNVNLIVYCISQSRDGTPGSEEYQLIMNRDGILVNQVLTCELPVVTVVSWRHNTPRRALNPAQIQEYMVNGVPIY